MKAPVTIYDRNGWKLESQGNGAFYSLHFGGESVFLQGDDADSFRGFVMESDGFLRDNCELCFDTYRNIMTAND